MNSDIRFTEEEFELAERYLLGQMTAAEKRLFEEKLSADTKLKEAVDQLRLQILGVQEAALSKMLNRFHEELPVQEKAMPAKVKLFSAKRWLAAASVAFIIAFGCWFFLFRKSGNEKLYAVYFSPDPGLMTTMGTADNYTFDRAMVDYKTGNYTAALATWKVLLKTAPLNDTLHYFIGAALLAGNQAREAIPYLQKIRTQPRSYFYADAAWYLGLALLKENKKAAAAAAIGQSNHPQKEALLKALQQ